MLALFATFFVACNQDDANSDNVYDNVNGQLGIGFNKESSSTIIVPDTGITVDVPVRVTTLSGSDRSYQVNVNADETNGSPADYTIGSLVVPANTYFGTLNVELGNFNNLPDLVVQQLVLDIVVPEGAAVVGFESYELNYLKYVVCNDLVLTLNEDRYADERTWEITDANGNVVQSGGPYAQIPGGQQIVETFTLADGCYTFTIMDSFGDGQFDGAITGNYSLDCSIITHASGEGNWGGSESTDFCVNP